MILVSNLKNDTPTISPVIDQIERSHHLNGDELLSHQPIDQFAVWKSAQNGTVITWHAAQNAKALQRSNKIDDGLFMFPKLDNVHVHRVAANSIDFKSRATRDSVCNILLFSHVNSNLNRNFLR